MKKKIGAAVAVVALAAGLSVGVAAPASASQAWVYVVVNNRVCGTPGAEVKAILSNYNWGSGSSTIGWDRGDNVVYPRIDTGKQVSYQMTVECFLGSRAIGYRSLSGVFTPSYHQQTIGVG